MLIYDTRRVEMAPFNCLHDPILKNAKIQNLCHLPLYLAHVTRAIGSHTTPHKTSPPPSLIVWLIWWACNWDSPSLTCLSASIKLKSIDLSLITENHPIPIMDTPILMTLSKFQLATYIFGRHWWFFFLFSLMTQDLLHRVHTSLCWCSLPHSSAHSKHSSRLQHYLIHQWWWLLHMFVIE